MTYNSNNLSIWALKHYIKDGPYTSPLRRNAINSSTTALNCDISSILAWVFLIEHNLCRSKSVANFLVLTGKIISVIQGVKQLLERNGDVILQRIRRQQQHENLSNLVQQVTQQTQRIKKLLSYCLSCQIFAKSCYKAIQITVQSPSTVTVAAKIFREGQVYFGKTFRRRHNA